MCDCDVIAHNDIVRTYKTPKALGYSNNHYYVIGSTSELLIIRLSACVLAITVFPMSVHAEEFMHFPINFFLSGFTCTSYRCIDSDLYTAQITRDSHTA